MIRRAKQMVFLGAKSSGTFRLCRKFFRSKIRVLCYHGFTIADEGQFRPKLFISPETFRARLRYLAENNFNVISLSDAIDAIRTRNMPRDAVVITIDDGFYSVYSKALPLLMEFGFPATLYLTSYYFDKTQPVFPLAVNYMFWSTRKSAIDWQQLGIPHFSRARSKEIVADNIRDLIEFGQKLPDDCARETMLRLLGELLEVDYNALKIARTLALVNKQEIKSLLEGNIDIQLHTHRHEFPVEPDAAAYEIQRNRAIIEQHSHEPVCHFCYPSGIWYDMHWETLKNNGVISATTCTPGLTDPATPVYAIPRFLDSSLISQIEFESELAGFSEVCRHLKIGTLGDTTTNPV